MNLVAKIRARRADTRTRAAVRRAVENAPTPAMRNELAAIAHAHLATMR